MKWSVSVPPPPPPAAGAAGFAGFGDGVAVDNQELYGHHFPLVLFRVDIV